MGYLIGLQVTNFLEKSSLLIFLRAQKKSTNDPYANSGIWIQSVPRGEQEDDARNAILDLPGDPKPPDTGVDVKGL